MAIVHRGNQVLPAFCGHMNVGNVSSMEWDGVTCNQCLDLLPFSLSAYRELKAENEKLAADNNALRANSYNTRIAELEAENVFLQERLREAVPYVARNEELKDHLDSFQANSMSLIENLEAERTRNLSVALESELAAKDGEARLVRESHHICERAGEEKVSQLLEALRWLLHDMHQTYANTSHRGRGIGGQTFTLQCHVISPEGPEVERLEEVTRLMYEGFAEREGRNEPSVTVPSPPKDA